MKLMDEPELSTAISCARTAAKLCVASGELARTRWGIQVDTRKQVERETRREKKIERATSGDMKEKQRERDD